MATKSQVKLPQKKPMSITAIKRLLGEYIHTKGKRDYYPSIGLNDYIRLMNAFIRVKGFSDQTTRKFNIFEPLGFEDKEVIHSKILEWLFKRNENHGQKSAFLKLFLKTQGLNIKYATYADYEVDTEVSEEESRIDIRISRPGRFLINIENKIFANQGEDQLIREERDAHKAAKKLKIKEANVHCFYLTVDPDDVPSKESINHITWGGVIMDCLNSYIKHVKDKSVRLFIDHYMELIKDKIIRGYKYDNAE